MSTQINDPSHVELAWSVDLKDFFFGFRKKEIKVWTNLSLIIWHMSLLEIAMCERDEPPNDGEKHPRADEAQPER